MKTKILLTSFTTWLPHQQSNSSDDILAKIQLLNDSDYNNLFFLRKLPVDVELASKIVMDRIKIVQPDIVICCGMAEKRQRLEIESNAVYNNKCLFTSIDLLALTKQLVNINISHNAGKFVCEGLYYKILQYIQSLKKQTQCVFVHIPILNRDNLNPILNNFQLMFHWFENEMLFFK